MRATLMFFRRFLFTRWRRRKQVKLACQSHRLSLSRYHWYNKTFTHAYLQKEFLAEQFQDSWNWQLDEVTFSPRRGLEEDLIYSQGHKM